MPSGVISLTDLMKGLSAAMRTSKYQGPEVFTTTGTTTGATAVGKDVGASAAKKETTESF